MRHLGGQNGKWAVVYSAAGHLAKKKRKKGEIDRLIEREREGGGGRSISLTIAKPNEKKKTPTTDGSGRNLHCLVHISLIFH